MNQVALDFSAPRPKPTPTAVPGGALRDAIRVEAFAVLSVHGRGRANAWTGDRLAEEVQARLAERGLAQDIALRTLVRRIEEGLLEMLVREEPICSFSSPPRGYCLAVTVEELEESLGENRRRALNALRRQRWSKRALARLRGQADLGGTT